MSLTTFIPAKSSCNSLARLSVQTMAFRRITKRCLMIEV
jgi:hypothetical protein